MRYEVPPAWSGPRRSGPSMIGREGGTEPDARWVRGPLSGAGLRRAAAGRRGCWDLRAAPAGAAGTNPVEQGRF